MQISRQCEGVLLQFGIKIKEKLIIAVNCNKVINWKVTGNKSYPSMPVIRAPAKRRLFKDVSASVFFIISSTSAPVLIYRVDLNGEYCSKYPRPL